MKEERRNRLPDALAAGLALVFLLPFVSVPGHLFPAESGKVWAFLALVELTFPLYALLALARPEYRPPRSLVSVAVFAFLAVLLLAALSGSDPVRSFWSKPSRLTGVFFHLHLVAFFVMAASLWRGRWRKVVGFMVAAAAAVSLRALYEAVHLDWDRAEAGFANATFLGQYLAPHLFLALWMARERRRRPLWLFAAALIAAALLTPASRGALVGVTLGAAVFAAVLWAKGEGKAKAAGRLAALALAGLGLLYLAGHALGPVHSALYARRVSLQHLSESTGARALALGMAWSASLERPLLGWGPEASEYAMNARYDPRLLRYGLPETRWDRVHSEPLEIFVSGGILLFVAWIFLYGAAFRAALRRRGVDAAFATATLAAVLGTNLFLFMTAAGGMLLFAAIAWLDESAAVNSKNVERNSKHVVLNSPVPHSVPAGRDPENERTSELRAMPWLALLALSAASSLAFVHGVVKPFQASARTDAFLRAMADPPPPEELMRKADAIIDVGGPYAPLYARLAAPAFDLPPGLDLSPGYASVALRLSDAVLDEAESVGRDYELYLGAVKAVMSVPSLDEDRGRRVERAISKMRELSPRRQETEWLDGRRLRRLGQEEAAEAAFVRAVSYDPEAAPAVEALERYRSASNSP